MVLVLFLVLSEGLILLGFFDFVTSVTTVTSTFHFLKKCFFDIAS